MSILLLLLYRSWLPSTCRWAVLASLFGWTKFTSQVCSSHSKFIYNFFSSKLMFSIAFNGFLVSVPLGGWLFLVLNLSVDSVILQYFTKSQIKYSHHHVSIPFFLLYRSCVSSTCRRTMLHLLGTQAIWLTAMKYM